MLYALVSARIPLKGVFSAPPRICMYTCMYTQFIGFRETAGCDAAVAFWSKSPLESKGSWHVAKLFGGQKRLKGQL